MNEQELRGALAQLARRVPEPDLADRAWDRAHTRRSRSGRYWLAATVVTTAAVVLGAIWIAPRGNPPRNEPEPVVSQPAGIELNSFYESSLAIPELAVRENSPTFVLDGRLWYGADMEITEGVRGTLTAEDTMVGSNLGWIAQMRRPELVAGQFGPMGGDFEPFPYQDTSNPRVFAAAPSGDYIAMGRSLLDGEGNRIGDLPNSVDDTQAWTPVGLVYTDAAGGAWLWNPDAEPERLDSTYNVNVQGWGIVNEGDCSVLYHLQREGAAEKVFEDCGKFPLVTMSPDWAAGPKLVVAANGDVIDTRSGELVRQLDLPQGLWELRDDLNVQWGGWYRGNSSNSELPQVYLSYTVNIEQARGAEPDAPYRFFILGCRVSTGDCGRTLPMFSPTGYSDAAVIPFVYR